MSYVMPCQYTKKAVWRNPRGPQRGNFNPKGKATFAYPSGKKRLNPAAWDSDDPIWSARIFVGFNVGKKPTYTMNDLVPIVKRVRKKQIGVADSTFLYQRGIYTHKDGKTVVDEKGGQVIILNLSEDVGPRKFEKQMIDLADTIRKKLKQEAVIIEIQKGGIVQKTIGVEK